MWVTDLSAGTPKGISLYRVKPVVLGKLDHVTSSQCGFSLWSNLALSQNYISRNFSSKLKQTQY